MEDIELIRSRINNRPLPVKEKKIIKVFNAFLVILLIGIGSLMYFKYDENGTIIKKIFGIDVSFKAINQNVELFINETLNIKSDLQENEVQNVTLDDPYINMGENNYATASKSILALKDGKVITRSYQNEYQYFIAIEYENNTKALYTHVDEVNVEVGDNIKTNQIIGKYLGDTFNCVFTENDIVITYEEFIKKD